MQTSASPLNLPEFEEWTAAQELDHGNPLKLQFFLLLHSAFWFHLICCGNAQNKAVISYIDFAMEANVVP